MKRKMWTPQEDAWLYVNLGEGNIALSELLQRTIPSIESRKRQIRNDKVVLNKDMVSALGFMTYDLKSWLSNPKPFVQQYIESKTTVGVVPTIPLPPIADRDDSVSCLEGKEKELGIDNGSAESKGLNLYKVFGVLAVVALITLLILLT